MRDFHFNWLVFCRHGWSSTSPSPPAATIAVSLLFICSAAFPAFNCAHSACVPFLEMRRELIRSCSCLTSASDSLYSCYLTQPPPQLFPMNSNNYKDGRTGDEVTSASQSNFIPPTSAEFQSVPAPSHRTRFYISQTQQQKLTVLS